MRTVLVLGAGQVGTFAARAVADEGGIVVAADRAPAPEYFARFGPSAGAKLATADILSSDQIGALIEAYAVDTVVLCAGLTGEACANDPREAWDVNVLGPEVVARAALRSQVQRLVFVSSFAVYGRPSVDRIDETVPVRPETEYGRTKAAAEDAVARFQDDGLDVRILRPCGIYGPRRPGRGSRSARLMESLLLCAVNGRACSIKASPASADEYLYVKDLGRAIALAALRDTDSRERVFNVGPGNKTNARELCSALRRVVPGARVTIESVDGDSGRPTARLDVSRFLAVFGFGPRYDLVDGLADYLQEARLPLTTPEAVTGSQTVPGAIRIPAGPEDVGAATLLGVCASLKPAPGHQGRSATRSILSYALETVGQVYPDVALLDLRDHPPPLFDGRMPQDHGDPTLEFGRSCVGRAGALLLAVPAYWSGVSGVFKNFIDTLCGPAYEMADTVTTVFADKPVGLLIVGADDASARAGADQARQIMQSTGAQVVDRPVVVVNPRSGVEAGALSQELIALAAELARHAHLARGRSAHEVGG